MCTLVLTKHPLLHSILVKLAIGMRVLYHARQVRCSCNDEDGFTLVTVTHCARPGESREIHSRRLAAYLQALRQMPTAR